MEKHTADILIIGAGSAGLSAGRVLAEAGKKVIILEARDRIGGRIFPLDEKKFGYPAQGGAEFVHGIAPLTHKIIHEAGLTVSSQEGDVHNYRSGKLVKHESFIEQNDTLKKKLEILTEDMTIAEFLERYFDGEKDKSFIHSVKKMVEGYDAADTNRISTFMLRDEWLKTGSLHNERIHEGYGALVDFLKKKCVEKGVEIKLAARVKSIQHSNNYVSVTIDSKHIYEAEKVIVTVPVPTIKNIDFTPKIPHILEAATKIGFGSVIKIILKFENMWWQDALCTNMRSLGVMLSNDSMTWWTQYPNKNHVLTGWIGGPEATKYKDFSSDELLGMSFDSLCYLFKINKDLIRKSCIASDIVNWGNDPLSEGAYSYSTLNSGDARRKISESVNNTIFFAGEAFYNKGEQATVESALASGQEVAFKILEL